MAITRSEDLFGDGSTGNPQVPIDTGNPPGHGSDNRGIAFGEQLTSAIANRSHYALALNDDDLDDRIGLYETSGLDAAYDLGAAAISGGGRLITKDGGAVETQSESAGLYVDDPVSAHWRANALGDTAGSSVGFDFVGKRSSADALSGMDPVAGFMDRRAVAIPAGSGTEIAYQNAATLRPSGQAANVVRLDTGTFFSGSQDQSEIFFGIDLLEIEGSASSDGVYAINAAGNADTDVELLDLNGQSPTFPTNDETCTVTLYRYSLATFGFVGRNTPKQGVSIRGLPGTNAALSLVPGRSLGSREDQGSEYGLRLFSPSPANGVLISTFGVDAYGRALSSSNQTTVPEQDGVNDDVFYGPTTAGFLTYRTGLTTNSEEVGFMARGDGLPSDSTRYDFLSLVNVRRDTAFNSSAPSSEGDVVDFPFTFTGSGSLTIDSGVTANWWIFVPMVGTLVYVSDPAANRGLYTIASVDPSSGNEVTLLSLSGASPQLPSSGSGTLTFLHANHVGRGPSYQVMELSEGRSSDLISSACFVAGSEPNTTALALSAPSMLGSSFLRCIAPGSASESYGNDERFYVDSDGSMGLSGTIYVDSVGSATEPRILHSLDDTSVAANSLLYQGRREDLTGPNIRQYVSNQDNVPSFLFTANAEQDGLGFSYDDSTYSATALNIRGGTFNLLFQGSGLSEPFGFDKRLLVEYNGSRDAIDMSLYGWLEFNSADPNRNPNVTEALPANTLTPKHVDKAWCRVFFGGGPTLTGGVNVASVSVQSPHLEIVLATPLVNFTGIEAVVVSGMGTGGASISHIFQAHMEDNSTIHVTAYNISDGTRFDLAADPDPHTIAVVLKGEQ